jgi:hypothetical protein
MPRPFPRSSLVDGTLTIRDHDTDRAVKLTVGCNGDVTTVEALLRILLALTGRD